MGQSSSELPGGRAVGGAHAEVLGQVAPGLGAVAQRAAAHAGGVVLVGAFAGQHGVRRRPSHRPRRAGLPSSSGPKALPSTVVRWLRRSSLRQSLAVYHLPRSSRTTLRPAIGQFLGDDAARGARADNDCVDALHERRPFLQVVLRAAAHGRLSQAQHPPAHGVAIAAVARRAVVALHGVLADQIEEGADSRSRGAVTICSLLRRGRIDESGGQSGCGSSRLPVQDRRDRRDRWRR